MISVEFFFSLLSLIEDNNEVLRHVTLMISLLFNGQKGLPTQKLFEQFCASVCILLKAVHS